jgi:hypothetical protein
MPTIKSNLSAKKETASLPINPPEPVITAIFIFSDIKQLKHGGVYYNNINSVSR